jgi:hypothetical protein
VALASASLLLALAPTANAWNAHGHMLVALLAYDALSEDKRATIARLLEAHPRYREDLLTALPAELTTDEQRSRWLFAYAATWPDIVAKQSALSHGTWHYVNLPLELRSGELLTCREAKRRLPDSRRRVTSRGEERRARGEPDIPQGDSILEALPENRATLADPAASPAARALALSWVLHLVGDAHQPLHGVALFTDGRFLSGDRGGNDITILEPNVPPPARTLHRVWDELIGTGTGPAGLDAALARLRVDKAAFRRAQAASRTLDVATWVDEDCELARSAVYVPAIRAAVERFERRAASTPPATAAGAAVSAGGVSPGGVSPDKPQVSLRRAYFTHAAEKARERVLAAGLRLAALLDAAL